MKTARMYSPTAKILSLILSFLIVFYLVPASVYAEGLVSDTTDSDNYVSENEENNTYIPEIYEVTELREENVKHFRLEDGSYVAAQYNYPVHYTDENGKFEDIDNRLVESGSEFSTGNSRVKFIKKITGNGNIFTIHENNTKITMGLVGAEKKTKGVVTGSNNSDDAIDDALGKMTNLENLSSTIRYEDILDGVDIEYLVHSMNIKENIIVKEKKDSYSYTFTLELNNLTAVISDDGNVYIKSYDGEAQYVIPAPVVFDANGIYAPDDASAYTLYEIGNGKYELTVIVNSSWMNAEERAFPVTIDPPMMSSGGSVIDFNIDQEAPNTNTNGDQDLYISSTERAYLKFDENTFANIPIGASIMKAELSIIGGRFRSSTARVGAYAITTSWDSTLTWNKTLGATPQGKFDDVALDYLMLDSGNSRRSFNITELYKRWLNGSPNYGLGLRLVDETSNEAASFTTYEYYPPDDDGNFYEPVIMVTYIYNDGLENYYPTSTHSAGVGGVGSINLSTGRLTLAIPTLTTTDYLFAFTPTLVYNSSLSGEAVTCENTSSALSTSYMPDGFKLNIQETIIEAEYQDVDNMWRTYYILYDADGSTHRFYRNRYSGPYYDDDGLQLTLTVGTNEITVEDIDHNVKNYSKINNSSWYLTSIKDKYGNELIFSGGKPGKPEIIYVKPNGLSNIEMLRLLYNGDKLCAVYNDSSKDAVILRYSENNLAAIQYCYGNTNTIKENVEAACSNPNSLTNLTVYATATYSYDNLGNIVRITDNNSGKSLLYEIIDEKITKLSEYAGSTLGQQVSYSYGEGYTDARSTGNDEMLNTADDIITRYIFDGYGRSVSAYSMSLDEEIYGATVGSYDDSVKSKNSLKSTTILDGVNPADIIKDYSGDAPLLVTLQGGIDKTEDTGCYNKTVFEANNVATMTESNADMEFIISGFGMANSIVQNGYADFSLGVNVYYYQGPSKADEVVKYRFSFADVENVWQYVCGKFYCKLESTEEISYEYVSKIEVVCTYYGHLNVGADAACAYFKDIALTDFTETSGYNYNYVSSTGNLQDKSNSLYGEQYEYDDQNRVTKITNSYRERYEYVYAYDEENDCYYEYEYYYKGEEEDDDLVLATAYIYNSYGLLTNISCLGSATTNISPENLSALTTINTSYQYYTYSNLKYFGALLRETDALGNSVYYTYYSGSGLLNEQINLDQGTSLKYVYDEAGKLMSVTPYTSNSTVECPEKVEYGYDSANRLESIQTDSTTYSLLYDTFGNSSGVNIGDRSLATYEYYPNNGKIKKINYGNEFSEDYVYNTLELLAEIWYTYDDGTSEKAYSYEYNHNGTLAEITDHRVNKKTKFEYDNRGRLILVKEKENGDTTYNAIYRATYSPENQVSSQTNIVSYSSATSGISRMFTTTYGYDDDSGYLTTETLGYLSDNHKINYAFDNFGRISSVASDFGSFDYTKQYTYVTDGTNTSYLVGSYTSTVGTSSTTYNYTYDSNGNITKIIKNGTETTYSYDNLGQLIKEQSGRVTKNYTYDNAGNITSIKTVTTRPNTDFDHILYAVVNPGLPSITTVTKTLSYTDSEWGDLLTSYDGTTITYDEIGNPLSYYNGSAYTFTWEGRKLVGAVKGSNVLSFTYDDSGIRTSKTVNAVVHTYQLNGSQIVSEEWEDKLIVYLYDASGSPIGMMYRTTSYALSQWDIFWFEKNLQGDIVAVYNSAGTKVATYTYSDAWGNHSVSYLNGGASTGVQYNSFRYRGYYYDTDLEMYYLQSRYYDANICRFINADSALYHSMLGYNMFAYCENNPVNLCDFTGEASASILEWWYTSFGRISSATPTVVDDLVWVAGILLLSGTISGIYEETPYYNPLLDFNYNQQFIYDPVASSTIVSNSTESHLSDISVSQLKSKEEVDPHRREGQKKQGDSLKNKSRLKDSFKDMSNKRHGREKPKKHTPGRDHDKHSKLNKQKKSKKYFSTNSVIDIF